MPTPQPGAFEYTGRELESMAFAVNYHRWILRTLRPFLGRRIVEVGAGTGSLSELILETEPASLTSLEPSANMYPLLAARLKSGQQASVRRAMQATLSEASATIVESGRPDSVLYINVLEHIGDDQRELSAAHELLEPGGHVLIFVPAQRWLMSEMDRQVGHFRRYTKAELTGKCLEAGFTIRLARNFDIFGIAPWWLKYRLLGSTQMESGLVWLYDRGVVPIAKVLEGLIPPPIGKNVIIVGQKN